MARQPLYRCRRSTQHLQHSTGAVESRITFTGREYSRRSAGCTPGPAPPAVDTGKVGEDLRDPGGRDVMLRGQIRRRRGQPGPLLRRRRHTRRRCRTGHHRARTPQSDHAVLGNLDTNLGQVEHLPTHRLTDDRSPVQRRLAPRIRRRKVPFHMISDRDPEQSRARRPGLLARRTTALTAHRAGRRLGQAVLRRRCRGVTRMPAQLAFQLRAPGCELLDHLRLGHHQREQLLTRKLLGTRHTTIIHAPAANYLPTRPTT